MQEISEFSSYEEAIVHLLIDGYLTGALEGIAKQVKDGERHLTRRQRGVITSFLDQFCEEHPCELCGNLDVHDIPIWLMEKHCGYCAHRLDRDD